MSQTLFYNGSILTMENDAPAEALCSCDGRIKALGDLKTLKEQYPHAICVDLNGKTLLPSFFDAHGHIVQYAMSLRAVSLEGCKSVDEIVDTLNAYVKKAKPNADDWVVGFGYDHTRFAPPEHPDRFALDRVEGGHPVIVSHQGGHMGVCNSLALQKAGVTDMGESPMIARDARDGRPNGYLEESVFMNVASVIPAPGTEEKLQLLDRAQEIYLSYGITTAQEGRMQAEDFSLLALANERGLLKLDVVGYADITQCAALPKEHPEFVGGYKNHLRIGGYKLFLDGSPQGRTAWLTKPYLPLKPSDDPSYRAYAIHTDEETRAYVEQAKQAGLQLLCHCNGDAAIDQFINAHTAYSSEHNVIVHAQLMRPDQLPRVKALGLIPSFFPAHTRYWGDVHIKNLGRARADLISPCASAQKLGIPFTLHQDTPVLPPSPLTAMSCACTRISADGELLGAQERISAQSALHALLINAALQYGESADKGQLSPGMRADLLILDRNPLKTPTDALESIRTCACYKDGTLVFGSC